MLVTINSSRTHLVEMTESVEAQQCLVKGIFRKFTGMKTERFPHVFLIEVKIDKQISLCPMRSVLSGLSDSHNREEQFVIL